MTCEWLTVKEVAEALKVTTDTVQWWIRKGKLDFSTTPGGTRRVCKANLVQPGRKGPPPLEGLRTALKERKSGHYDPPDPLHPFGTGHAEGDD